MVVTRREALGVAVKTGAAVAVGAAMPATVEAQAVAKAGETIPGLRPVKVPPPARFTADWGSLAAGYSAPDWFRDAKFGIWAHWGAPSVPGAGDDWYARNMYEQGHPSYEHHLKHYGHPTDSGFMQIHNMWKAQNWQPEALMDLYHRSGARYFMALANHHDNFDCFDSAHHAWNATRVGPKRDIVGTWAKLARAKGIRFAVSNHSGHAWHWNQVAYNYDIDGPRAGQRYDAARLTRANGKGQWWDGLDPADLYTRRTMAMPDGIGSLAERDAFHAAADGQWWECAAPDPAFTANWAARVKDLVEKYQPDMLYFDDHDLPLGQTGIDIAAWFLNRNMDWNGGRLEGVVTAKETPAHRRMGLVDVVERGAKGFIDPYPWQTETCLGNWFYGEDYFLQKRYKTPAKVIHTLCDVVSKNGNFMLSVPLKADGTIDAEEQRIVETIGAWMRRHGSAIYGSRPWRVFGEGPTNRAGNGAFSEGSNDSTFTPADVRYVTQGARLNALVLGWPVDGVARLTLLAAGHGVGRGHVARVTLADGRPLAFTRTDKGLEVRLPDEVRDPLGVALCIDGEGLTSGNALAW